MARCSRRCLPLLLEGVEEQTAGLAAGIHAAVHAQTVDLLAASAVDLANLEHRSDVPDVDEGHAAELGAPLHGDADAVEGGEQHVGQPLAELEAAVGIFPNAVTGVSAFGLSEHILECDLK